MLFNPIHQAIYKFIVGITQCIARNSIEQFEMQNTCRHRPNVGKKDRLEPTECDYPQHHKQGTGNIEQQPNNKQSNKEKVSPNARTVHGLG